MNTNGDIMLMHFTCGMSGEPKIVAHGFSYAIGHLTTGVFRHNLSEDGLHLTVTDTGWARPYGVSCTASIRRGGSVRVLPPEVYGRQDVA